jgi:predicted ester cyclase
MAASRTGAYGADDDLVDYILGITFEIWEQGRIELIDQYYSAKTVVYGLDGIVHGAAAMQAGTRAVLAAFPDRLLLGDDVITSGDSHRGYSSHRVLSPATNTGESMFGPATGKAVRFLNMADCVIEEGVITDEWLVRDNLALVRQLGFSVHDSAAIMAGRHTQELKDWFGAETERLNGMDRKAGADLPQAAEPPEAFAGRLLDALWLSGDAAVLEAAYAPYAVLHRSPIEIESGLAAIADHYAALRHSFAMTAASVDHVATQPAGHNAEHVAVRWSACGSHSGEYLGVAATGKPVFILGVTHRRIIDGRIAVEWTVFDSLGVLAQLL